MKKLVNVVTLVVMVSVNTMTPFTYAFAQYDEPVYSQEVVEVSDDTADSQISGQATAGDSSSETGYEENIQDDSSLDFSLNTESQTSAEEQGDTQDSQQSGVNFADAQNDDKQTEGSETQDEEPVEFDFSGKSAAAVTKMLGGNWETDSDGYAEALGIENYQGYPEQNEIIRNYMVTNKSLPEKGQNTQDSSLRSEGQAGSEGDTQISDDENGEDDEDPLPEKGDTQDSLLDAQNDSEHPEGEDEMGFFDELGEGIQNLFDKIRYFFTDEENESYIIYSEDDNNIGTITLKDPETAATITIMDRNLGAEKVNDYGYYFQWGNNHGVEEVNSTNKTTIKAIYDDSYYGKGYDGNGLFIVGDSDYRENGNHYNNLWGGDLKEQYKQASCPAGYHVPTAKEWNQLMSIWGKIHTQDVSVNEEGQNVSQTRYTANSSETKIASFKDQAQQCEESDTQCVDEDSFSDIINILSSELRLPLAGGYDEDGKYYDEGGIYWTSTARDGEKALIFDINAYFGINGDDDLGYKAQGHNIRCFQNVTERYVEEDTQDSQQTEQAQQAEGTSADASEGQGDTNNNPGSASMTDQDGNGTQNENEVEPGLNVENSSEGQAGDDESAKTDSDISVLDYLFHEGVGDSASSPFPGDEEDNLEQSFTGDVENLSGSALELATAWEILNVEPITKEERYNNVTVNVEAPAGTFPEGTYANIKPIVSTVRLDEIKGQISEEDNTVSENSEVVAFDITFMYKLSDGTEVEVQPKENTVKVTFNYEDNDELSKADETQAQEVKVFHIEEVMDEDGNKTGEKEVNDVTNKEESAEDGIAVADAESFSLYVLTVGSTSVILTLDPQGGTFNENDTNITITCDQENDTECYGTITADANGEVKEPRFPDKAGYMFLGWFDAASGGNRFEFEDNPIISDKILYAHWAEFEKLNFTGVVKISGYPDGMATVTIMDRNLGATEAGIGTTASADSYGYLYEYGNNHGFSLVNKRIPNEYIRTDQVDVTDYSWENPFYSKYYIKRGDNWMTSSSNKNLWGGANDILTNYYGENIDPSRRQGPCPEGYHIPSVKEWYDVVDILFQKYGIDEKTDNNYKYPEQVGKNPKTVNEVKYMLGDYYDDIEQDLNLVYFGRIKENEVAVGRDASSDDPRAPYWTSSDHNNKAFIIEFGLKAKALSLGGFEEPKPSGYGVRCFKDVPDYGMVKFELNGGNWDVEDEYLAYERAEGIELPSEQPEKYAYNFDGWYTDDGTFEDEVVDRRSLDSNVTLYAKYVPKDKYLINFVVEGAARSKLLMEGEIPSYDEEWPEPTKPDQGEYSYRFDGWNDGTTKYELGEELPVVTGPATYTAVFEQYMVDRHRVSYDIDGDGHEDNVEYISKIEGENIITLPVAPTKAGYDFAGWKTGSEEPRAAESSYTVTDDTDFVAQWTPHDYSIVYDYDGGTAPYQTNPISYNVEDNTRNIYSPTKSAYKFVGWKEYVCNEDNVNQCENWTFVRDILVYSSPTSVEIGGMGHKKYEAQWTENEVTYTVIWITEDLTDPVKVSQETVGTAVSTIKPADPTKASDAQYSYSFVGWMKGNSQDVITNWENEVVEGFVIYKAKFTPILRQYAITFVDEDGETVLKSATNYDYGTSAADIVQPATPTKTDTVQWDYEFDGWDPALADVTQDQTYRATYSETLRQYEITFVDEDGTTSLQEATLFDYNSTPIYSGPTPTKSSEGGYRYAFNGWTVVGGDSTVYTTDNLPTVNGNVTYKAHYTSNPFVYDVTLDPNGDGTVNPTIINVTYNSTYGNYNGSSHESLPEPEWDGYNFVSWNTQADGEGTPITASTPVGLSANGQTLYAQWTPTNYTLSFVDDDDTPLVPSTTYTIGSTISLTVPTKEGYTFIGWKEYVDGNYTRAYLASDLPLTLPAGNIGDRKYVAQWNLNGHVVIWLDDDERILDIDTNVPDETLVTEIEPAEPTKAQDDQYTYTFDKWLKEVIGGNPAAVSDWENEKVTDDVKYQASYQSHIRQYSVTFVGENGETVLQPAALYDYGTTAANITKPAEPTKAATAAHTYTFVGWKANGQGEPIPTVSLPNVTGNVTYWASFTETTNKYAVTFVDENGTTVLKAATQYDYNTPAVLIEQPATPTKPETLSHTYTFAGWDPALANVTADATYRATYTSTPKQYTITLNPDGGVIEGAATTKEVTFGSTYGELPTPTKLGYTFGGWFDADDTQQQNEITSATVVTTDAINQTLKAKWTVQTFNIRYLEDDRQTPVTVSDPMTTYTVNNSIVIKNPTKEGHTFIGWKECVGNDCSTAYLKDGSSSITIPAGKTGDRDYLAIWNVHGHVVIWEDYNGVVLEIDPNVDYGDPVSYDVEDEDHNPKYPSREDTAEFDYEFIGWTDGDNHFYPINGTPAIPTMGDADITYTATYSETTKKYTITFVDADDTELSSKDYEYGTAASVIVKPAFNIPSPTSQCAEYQGAWDKEIVEVTGDETYKAEYTCKTPATYTITWKNYDGSILETDENVPYGTLPDYDEDAHGVPTKDLHDGKTYLFEAWDPAVDVVTKDEIYTATFTANPNAYGVTFNAKGGIVNPNYKVVINGEAYGDLPTPTKAGYTFDGWYSDDVTFAHEVVSTDTYTLTTNQTIYAKWNINNYDISYQNVENTYAGPATYTVEDENVTIPNPTKDGYTFVAWKEYVCNIAQCSSSSDWTFVKDILKNVDGYTIPQGATGDREFRAQWDINRYEITFNNYDDTILKVQLLDYGTPVAAPANPSKPNSSDGQYRYEFAGWKANGQGQTIPTANLPVATEDVEYIAQFNEITRQYTVTFQNYDETELQSSDVNYGIAPVYNGETPTKASTAQYDYTFSGWTDGTTEYAKDATLPTVTGETTYTAVFTQSPVKYTVTFVDWDGTELKAATAYDYGTVAADIVKPADPTKAATQQYTYTFAGWDTIPATMPAENVTVRATYSSMVNQYTVTFDSDDGSTVNPVTTYYNTAISRPADPKKDGYTFSKWQKVDGQTLSDYDFATPVTDNITLKAIWTKNGYTVTYKDGNQTITIPNATTSYTITDQITIPNPDKTGYTFIGWEEYVCNEADVNQCSGNDRSHVGDILKNGDSITIPAGNIGHREFIAQWNINRYEVKFLNYDRSILKVQMLDYDSSVTAPSTEPTRIDSTGQYTYSFIGWKANGEGDLIPKTSNLPNVSGNVDYIAQFSSAVNQYKVTFVDEDGTTVIKVDDSDPNNYREYDYGTKAADIAKPADPTKTGWRFAGWDTIPATMPAQDVIVRATYTINQYKVTFVDEDGTTVIKVDDSDPNNYREYDYGTKAADIAKPADPTKEGYTFAGWDTVPATMPAQDVTVRATYTINQYTITFDSNGGSAVASITQNYGTDITAPANPTKEGYTFAGWTPAVPATMPAENVTLTAQWTANGYKVVFHKNDEAATGEMSDENFTYDEASKALTANSFSKEGYTFAGWATSSNGDVVYTDGQSVKNLSSSVNGVVDLYAKWTANSYTVSFDANLAGVEDPEDKQVIFDSTYGTLPTLTKEGYTFNGWFTAAQGGTQVTAETTVNTANAHTLHAHWTANTYTVSFDANLAGVEDPEDKQVTFDSTYGTLPTLTKEGYTFNGWFTAAQGGTQVTAETTVNTANAHTLYAHWTANTHSVTYNYTKDAENLNPVEFTTDTPTINLVNLEKAGYRFDGWFTAAEGGTKVTQIVQGTTTNVVLYAHWTTNTYNITYTQVPSGYTAPATYNVEQSVTIPNPSKVGYTFKGWKEYVDGDYVRDYLAGNSVTIPVGSVGNREYEAQWEIIKYNVSFQSNGGAYLDSQTIDHGSTVSEPQNFSNTKEYYDFGGWYTDSALSNAYNFATPVTSNLVLYAKWTVHTYHVAYADEGTYTLANKWYTYTKDFIQNSIRTPSKEGYTFKGWSWKDVNGDDIPESEWLTYIDVTQNFFNTYGWKDYTFVPHWEINHYTVTFNSDGGSAVNPQTIDHGTTVTQPTAPTKENYTFLGWYNGNTAYDFATQVTSDITLTAHWASTVWDVAQKVSPHGTYTSTIDNAAKTISFTNVDLSIPDPTDGIDRGQTATWLGFKLTAPEAVKTAADAAAAKIWTYNDREYTIAAAQDEVENGRYVVYVWLPLTANEVETLVNNGTYTKSYTTTVSWDGTNEAKEEIVATVDLKSLKLSDVNGTPVLIETDANGEIIDLNQDFTVTFDTDGGTPVTIADQTIRYNTTSTAPADPTKEGYTFDGWFADGASSAYDFATPVKSDVDLTAHWTVNQYTITFDAVGGSDVDSITQDYGTAITAPTAPTKEGYTFNGWTPSLPVTMPATDMTVAAQWTANEYTVVFHSNNGGTETTVEQDFTYDEASKALTANTFSKQGYTFAGWATSTDGDVEYTNGQSVQNLSSAVDGVVDLYAKWTANEYTVTFNPGEGATVDPASKSVTFDSTYGELPTPTKEGHTFAGWYTDATAGTEVESSTPVTTANAHTLYAHWTINQYTITFDKANGDPVVEITQNYGTAIENVPTGFSKLGYHFVEWTPAVPATMPAENMTISAQWEIDRHTVTASIFTDNDSTSSVGGTIYGAGEYDYGSEVTLIAVPSEGYHFVKWVDNGSEEVLSQSVKVIDSLTANRSFTAYFETNNYTVTFLDDDGSSIGIDSQTVEHGEKAVKPADPVREGYTFAGWLNGGVAYNFNAAVVSNLQLNASWTINQYTITFDANGGTLSDGTINPLTADYGTAITVPVDPTREGWRFTGWTPAIPATMPATDMTVVAQWAINQYTVTLVDDAKSTLSIISPEGSSFDYGTNVKVNLSFDEYYGFDTISSDQVTLTKESDGVYSFDIPAENVTITLKSKPIEYKIKYYLIGGELPSGESNPSTYNIVNYGEITLVNPNKVGNVFKGWQLEGGDLFYDGEGATHTQVEIDPDEVGEIQKFTATWKAVTYPVVYHVGDEILATLQVEHDNYANYLSQSRDGYVFDAWYTNSDFALEHKYDFGKVTGPLHLYARWVASEQKYHVYHKYLKPDGSVERTQHVEVSAYTDQYIPEVARNEDAEAQGYVLPEVQHLTVKAGADNEVIYVYERAPFTIKYMDGNTQIAKDIVLYGADITPIDNPTKEGYEFEGWYSDPELTQSYDIPEIMPNENITVYAKFIKAKYTVRYMDGEDELAKFSNVEFESAIPTISDPTKDGYTFDGWDTIPATMPAHDLYIQAKWTINKYTVTFVDEDGSTVLKAATEYDYGTASADIVKPADPTKAATQQYTYTFAGWDTIPATMPAENVTVRATYSSTVNQYTVTFVDEDEQTVLKEATAYDYGTSVADIEKPANPTKAATQQYTYTFDGWDTIPATVTDNVVVKATYSSTVNQYKVTFADENGTELKAATEYDYGTSVDDIEKPANPTKAADDHYIYTFAGWDPEIVAVDGDVTYTATYNSEAKKYVIKFVDEDDTELQSSEVEYGEMPAYSGQTPTKEATAQYTYTFAGWDSEIAAVTGEKTYKATYSQTVNKYKVRFVDEDGSTLKEAVFYDYGTAVADIDRPAPTKPATAEYTYTFNGWDPALASVVQDVTYTATYTQTPNTYTITFNSDGGTTIPAKTIAYGDSIPAVSAPEKEGHRFDGWSPVIPATMPAHDMFVTAQWTKYYYNLTFNAATHSKLTKKTVSQDGAYAYNDSVEVSVSVDDGYALSNITATATTSQGDQEVVLFDQGDGVYSFIMPANPVVISTEVEAIDYEIEYDLAGGSVENPSENGYVASYDMAHLTLTLKNPSREGYNFLGWKDEKGRTINAGNTTTTININSSDKSNKVYTAQWEAIVHTVKYYVDGQLKGNLDVAHGNSADISTYRPVLEQGYEFDGWYTDAGKNNLYGLEDITQATSLYGFVVSAQQDGYLVKHRYEKLGGGYDEVQVISDESEIVLLGDRITPDFRERDGFTNPLSQTTIVIKAGGIEENQVIYEYARNSYKVTYKSQGQPDQYRSVKYEDYIPVLDAPERAGYVFKGWKKVVNDEVTDESLTNVTTMSTSPVTYQATWDENTYTITFDTDGGSIVAPISGKFGVAVTAPANPTKVGYDFDGWDKEIPTTMPAENMTIKATWKQNTYTITFNTNGGNVISSISGPYGASVVIPANPTKEGYTFAGWDKSLPATMPAENVTINAQWTVNKYSISFDVDGGSNVATITQDYGTEITAPANPTKEGYTFAGWTPEIPTTMPAEDVDVTAQWTADSHSITYNDPQSATNPNPTMFKTDDADITLQDLSKVGYTFDGWYDAENGGNKVTTVTCGATDVVLYARWTKNSYAYTFEGEHVILANGSTAEGNIEYGQEVTLILDVDDGYKISSFTAPSNIGFTKVDESTWEFTMPDQDVNISAIVSSNEYNVTLSAGNNTSLILVSGNGKYAYGSEVEVVVLVDDGYNLESISAKVGNENITLYDRGNGKYAFIMPVGDVTVTSTAEIQTYSISYWDEGTLPDQVSNPTSYDINHLTLTLNNPSKVGYIFKGWKDEKGNTFNKVEGLDTITVMIPSNERANKTYTAQWDKQKYTVKYHVAGNIVKSEEVEYKEKTPDYRIEAENGYIFDAWYTSASCENSANTCGDDVKYTFGDVTNDIDLYGRFIATDISYVIKHIYLDVNGDEDRLVTEVIPAKVDQYVAQVHQLPEEGFRTPIYQSITVRAGADNTVTYIYERNSYTVTYKSDNQIVDTKSIIYGAKIPVIDAPVKEGYTFNGWKKSDSSDVLDGNTTMPASDVVYEAQWTINQYTITFNTDGGTVIDPITQNYGTAITAPADPTKIGYTFAGWNKDIPATMPAENITVTAQWTNNQHTITFDTDGGTVIDPITQNYGTAITAPADPSKEGYTFAGWDKDIPSTMPNEDVTITAQWTVNQYSISFNVEGGSNVATITQDYGTPITAPTVPTKEGYTFAGWTPSLPDTMPDEDMTLTANWNINTHIITFNSNGGSAVSPIQQEYGTAITIPANPTREGYTFAGWNAEIPTTMPDEDITLTANWNINTYTITYFDTDGAVIKSETYQYNADITPIADPEKEGYTFKSWNKVVPTKMPAENVTIVAVWNTNEWTLTFDTDGGTPIAAQTLAYGTTITKPANPTKEGYTFAGWNKTIPTTMPDEDVTIKAQWTINQYSITFDVDGGSDVTTITQDYGTPITAPTVPTKEGYTFKRWTPSLPTTMPAENVNVTAVWEINKYHVVLQDTENAELSYVTVPNIDGTFNYGTTIEVSLQIDDGYSFTIDSDDVSLVNKGNGVYAFIMPDKQVTITVTSSAKSYDINYVLDGGVLPDGASNPAHYNVTFLTLVFDNPTRVGYIFKGWKDETGRLFYDEGSDTTQVRIQDSPLVDKEYTAQWEAKTYLVKFEMENQIVDQQMVTHGGYANYVNQSRDGYEFPGWYTDPTFADGTEYNFSSPVVGNMTLYGKFIASDNVYRVINKYMNVDGISYVQTVDTHTNVKTDDFIAEVPISHRDGFVDPSPKSIRIMPNAENIVEYVYERDYFDIVYDVNGGTPEVATQTIMFGTKIPVPADPTRAGYTFKGWQKQGTTEILNDNTILNDAHTVTYVAQWKENEYTITFDTDGGSAIDPITQDYGTAITAPADPTKEGYTFAGWTPEIPATMPLNGLTVKAQWTANQYTITFDVDGGTEIAPIIQDYGTEITPPANPTKEGYVFAGWNPEIPATMPLNGLTVKAQWSLSGFTITFDTDGGSNIDPIIQDYGTPITAPADPTKIGHTFAGWDPEIPATMPAENITIKAKWTVNQYTIIFDTNGGSTIDPITQDYGTPLIIENPTKPGYTFKGWDPALPAAVPADDIVVVAQWEKSGGSSSGGGGGGGSIRPETSDDQEDDKQNPEDNMHGAAGDEEVGLPSESDVNEEVVEPEALSAYEWARKYGITTMDTVEEADPNGYVIRGHLAKMVVNYMVNVLGRQVPYDVPYECVGWNDDPSIWESDEIRDYATKACALGVMGIQMRNNEFKPNDIVTRAEFGTVVSRILWGDKYNSPNTKGRYRYTLHLRALKDEGIMTQITRPMKWLEIRKWVWVVMMRTQEFLNK